MKTFALIGAAGYIAPRHLKAIKETDNDLICALDPHDSVGILDSFFPQAAFFTEFERFDRHVEKLNRQGQGLDYVSICSPNYLHDAHIRWALRSGSNVICEKPLGLNPENIEALAQLEESTGRQVNTILQMRLHEEAVRLRGILNPPPDPLPLGRGDLKSPPKKHQVKLTYITPRGTWYKYSWKGDISKSGGIATNIGVHLFDLLIWLFGKVEKSHVHLNTPTTMAGYLELKNAEVTWYLSIDDLQLSSRSEATIPIDRGRRKSGPHRELLINNETFNFSTGFTDLHTKSYEEILQGNGFKIDQALPAIEVVSQIRTAEIESNKGEKHELIS